MFTQPHSAASREAISLKLIGRPKSQETRARMAASKLFDRAMQPDEWEECYRRKLHRIIAIDQIPEAE